MKLTFDETSFTVKQSGSAVQLVAQAEREEKIIYRRVLALISPGDARTLGKALEESAKLADKARR